MMRMDDLISRKAAIEVIDAVFPVNPMDSDFAQGIECGAALAKTFVEQLPSARPEFDEWCPDCKEYDQKRHCCPRFNRVIRETLAEVREAKAVIRCKDCKWCEDADGLMCKNPASWVVATGCDFGCVLAERRQDE